MQQNYKNNSELLSSTVNFKLTLVNLPTAFGKVKIQTAFPAEHRELKVASSLHTSRNVRVLLFITYSDRDLLYNKPH